MIKTYCEYIYRYVEPALKPTPGEHHFVAVYLLPRITRLVGVPDYVNPDGMKRGLPGDIVFNRKNKRRYGIEVKLGLSPSLTPAQRKNWLGTSKDRPSLICVASKMGLGLWDWKIVINHNGKLDMRNQPWPKDCSANLNYSALFPYVSDRSQWGKLDEAFMKKLKKKVKP